MHKIDVNGLEFYTIDRIEDIQKQMLRLLKIIDNICKDNGLKYFLDGGSAIGAYRHGGFIPWDDDLDISMLKPDYIKLISILKTLDDSRYFLFDYDFTLHCCGFWGEKVPFFSSSDGKKRHIYPIKIDIRPLNIIENSKESISENRLYREIANLLLFSKCNEDYKRDAIEMFHSRFDSDKKLFLSYYNREYGLYPDLNKAVLAHPYFEYSTEKVYKYKDIFPLKSIHFVDFDTYVPGTDALLTEVYKDYMEFPPIEERKPEACKVYDASNINYLYRYLTDKHEKTLVDRLLFSIIASLSCKR